MGVALALHRRCGSTFAQEGTFMRIAHSRVIGSMVAVALTAAGCAGGAGLETDVESAALTNPTAVSNVAPNGLIQSTGNLYWTANGRTVFPSNYWARVYRTGKYDLPGSEAILYSESSTLPVNFGDITWAYVGGNYYGYFVANYRTGTVIKRVPLSGGSATVMATAPNPVIKNTLVNDGTNLYWADSTGLYQMNLVSGATTEINHTPGIVAVAYPGVVGEVYFTDGFHINDWQNGTVATQYSSSTGGISALAALSQTYYWVEWYSVNSRNAGTVGGFDLAVGSLDQWGLKSLSVSGSKVVWSDCDQTTNTYCEVQSPNGVHIGVGNNANFAQSDSSAIFFGTDSGVFRTSY
jgi:hypothetical protein